MPITAPISRSVLSDQVKDHLLEEILAGRYPPGSRIVETRVARELGVSQAPVREALRDLEALGVVRIAAFQGARVRRPSKAELLEAFVVRAELESLGARLALPRMSDTELDDLQGFVDEMRAAATRGDAHGQALVDAAFHSRIVGISANHTLERVWHFLEPVSRTQITATTPGLDLRQIADLHQAIVSALRLRDPQGVTAAVNRHFEVVGELFEALFDEQTADPEAAPAGVRSADRPR